ncbi:MAG TPA: hypothetical protein VNQ90_07240 [Chthoniobacteraceae bacterium]|nr:hypothetical protein [Chthoniobacteraceae bacterium]
MSYQVHRSLLCCLFGFLLACGVARGEAKTRKPLVFEEGDSKVVIDGGGSGQMLFWKVDGKVLVDGPPRPAIVLETGEGGRQAVLAVSEAALHREVDAAEAKEGFPTQATLRGRLEEEGRSMGEVELVYRLSADLRRVELAIRFVDLSARSGAIKRLAWQQPLALSPRKKTFFQGDRGLEWESRYFYQFHLNTGGKLLKHPDRNEWRYFALDQLSPGAFRLWKAESGQTSPLIMQEGRTAAPFVQVFDQTGGVTLDYRQLRELAPKSLRVDADGAGSLIVEFWPGHGPALDPRSPEARSKISGVTHTLQLTAFTSDKARLEARKERALPASARAKPDPEEVMKEAPWIRETPLGSREPLYATGGYPFGRGELPAGQEVGVRLAGEPVPAQTRPLAYWPDGSIKWLQMTFPYDPALAKADIKPPYLSLRDGRFIPMEVAVGTGNASLPKRKIEVSQQDDTWQIGTGRLTVTLGTGEQWLRSLIVDGEEQLDTGSRAHLAYAKYAVGFSEALPFESPKGGTDDLAGLKVEEVTVLEEGPLRAVVRLSGKISNREETDVTLWLELLAGRGDLRITQATEFHFTDPRRTMLTGLGFEIPLKLKPEAFRVGGFEPAAESDRNATIGLLALTPGLVRADAAAPDSRNGEGWLAVQGNKLQAFGVMRDFRQMAPSGLAFSQASGTLKFELWPQKASPMDVRRYSDHPHGGQGEAVGLDPTPDYANDRYYPLAPFDGISRTREVLLSFQPMENGEAPATLAADFQSPPLLYAGNDRYTSTEVALPGLDAERQPRAAAALKRYAQFWLYHRELYQWYGFWTYGDFRHFFGGGYGWVLPPELLKEQLALGGEPAAIPPSRRVPDYVPGNDWAFDNGRWGWSNTEGLPGTYFQNEYLRRGNRVVFFMAEALARMARDVVTRQSGRWLGLGTRHGVQHWSDGNHEERQTVVLEYRLHYFLTGEPRSLDVLNKLYDHRYSRTRVRYDAAHSGRLPGLLFHWEVTNSPQEAEQLASYIGVLASPQEGIYEEPAVSFPGGKLSGERSSLNKGSMFFNSFGAMHALLEYERITRDPQLAAALISSAKAYVADGRYTGRKFPLVLGGVLGYAARYAPDKALYQNFLRDAVLERRGWQYIYQPVTQNVAHWSGPTAHLVSSIAGSWFWMNMSAYLVGGFEGTEWWTPEVESAWNELETNGAEPSSVKASWQGEYDGDPALEAYLAPGQPWRKKHPRK